MQGLRYDCPVCSITISTSESLSVMLFAAAGYFGQDPLIPCSWFRMQ